MARQVNLGQIVPNIQIGTTTTGNPGTQASVTNVGTALNPVFNFTIPKGDAGAIKMLIVAQLPQTGADDTIYLVPLETPTEEGNNYAEYVYINGAWELLGKIGVQFDASNYVQFTDYATPDTAGVMKVTNGGSGFIVSNGFLRGYSHNYQTYVNAGNDFNIAKGTLEGVITGKGLVSNTDYANSTTGGVIKTGSDVATGVNASIGKLYAIPITYANYGSLSDYAFISKGTLNNVLNATIGDIGTILDSINGESVGD